MQWMMLFIMFSILPVTVFSQQGEQNFDSVLKSNERVLPGYLHHDISKNALKFSPPIRKHTSEKSAIKAVGYSSGATFIPLLILMGFPEIHEVPMLGIVLSSSLIFGPSIGSMYADDYRTAVWGILIRSGAMLALGFGAITTLAGFELLGPAFMAGSIIVYSGSAIWDIFITGPRSVRDYNSKFQQASHPTWITPDFQSAGLSISYRF